MSDKILNLIGAIASGKFEKLEMAIGAVATKYKRIGNTRANEVSVSEYLGHHSKMPESIFHLKGDELFQAEPNGPIKKYSDLLKDFEEVEYWVNAIHLVDQNGSVISIEIENLSPLDGNFDALSNEELNRRCFLGKSYRGSNEGWPLYKEHSSFLCSAMRKK